MRSFLSLTTLAVLAGVAAAGPARATVSNYAIDVEAFAGFDRNGQYVGSLARGSNGAYTAGPTTGAGGTAAIAFGAHSASGGASENYGGNLGYSTAAVNIADGSLHARAVGATQYGEGSGEASFDEGLTFTNATAKTVYLPVRFTVEGSVSAITQSNARVTATASIFASSSVFLSYTAANGSNSVYVDDVGNTTPSTYTITRNGFFGRVYDFMIAVAPGTVRGEAKADLDAGCNDFSDCNYGDTAAFSFGPLPMGLTYTSDSGVFLTASSSPVPISVPEPTSAMLFTGAMIGLAMWRRCTPA